MDEKTIEALRAATEDDVEAALKDATFGDKLGGVETAALLEFHNLMLDRVLGRDPDLVGVGLIAALPTQH